MTSEERTRRAILCGLILLLPSGCAHASRASFCEVYQPVYTAPADTEETKSQTDGNNAAWLELCGD